MAVPRLLLFGSPGAGKSSLLGALAQAVAADASMLKGKPAEKSGLERLQKAVYDGTPPQTKGVESFDIHLQAADGGDARATLLDTNGIDALAMLKAEDPFHVPSPVHQPLLEADALLMVLDAAAPSKQQEEEIKQFGQWLMSFQEARGRRTDVAALPVYAVLTKCDKLAKPGDTFAKWVQHIEEKKQNLDENLRGHLKEQPEGFGSIDLRIWATAIRRPELAKANQSGAAATAKAKPEPLFVAELFRESIHSAADFHDRRQNSSRLLQNVVVGLSAFIAILGLLVMLLVVWHPDTTDAELAKEAQRLLPKKDSVEARLGLSLKRLDERRTELQNIQRHPRFDALPGETRDAVTRYRDEIDQYLSLSKQAEAAVQFPYVFRAKSEEEFRAQKKKLDEFTYPAAWDKTFLGKRVAQCRAEFDRVLQEVKSEENALQGQVRAGEHLFTEGAELQVALNKLQGKPKVAKKEIAETVAKAEAWENEYQTKMHAKPRFLRGDPIPGVSGVNYDFLDKFQSIKDTRRRLDNEKTRLKRVSENLQELTMELKSRS